MVASGGLAPIIRSTPQEVLIVNHSVMCSPAPRRCLYVNDRLS